MRPVGQRGVVFVALFALALSLFASSSINADAIQVQEKVVTFGVPRMNVAPNLDFEASCQVTATFAEVVVIDGARDMTFLAVSPGSCTIAVYVFGIAIPLPILETTLGSYQFEILDIGFIFGLANIDLELVTSLMASYDSTVAGIAIEPASVGWSTWGSKNLLVTAAIGELGSKRPLSVPLQLTMTFNLGLSVITAGFTWLSLPLASLGSFSGTPNVSIPVTVDLVPRPVSFNNASAPDPTSIHLEWTASPDSDFASYMIQITGGDGSSYTYAVESRGTTSLTLPASPDNPHTISIRVVDDAGLRSSSDTVEVTTPPLLESRLIPGLPTWTDWVILSLAGLVGLVVGWVVRGRMLH